MKKIKLNLLLMTCLMFGITFTCNAQWGAIKKAAKSTVKKTKKAGKAAYGGAKKAGKYTYGKSKSAGKAVYGGTKKAGKYTYGKSRSVGKAVYGGTKKAGKYTYGKSRSAGKAIYGGTKKAGKYTYGKSKKAGKAVYGGAKKVGNTSYKIASAPIKSAYNTSKVVRGKAGLSSIYKPYTEAIGATGDLVPDVLNGLSYPQKLMMRQAQKYASSVGGKYGGVVFDLTTFTGRYYAGLESALAQNVKAVANGQNPIQVVGAPLAAALRAARNSHLAASKPLPEDVKRALRGHFPEATLNKTRYAIGKVEITLPNLIGEVIKYGERHAVTVGDIIVFNVEPGSFEDTPTWWAHEVAHVQQYTDLGVESFAYKYMRDLGKSLEREAEEYAEQVTRF